MLEKINDTTWKQSKNVDEDVFDTEIGDIKQSQFEPQLKIIRWDNDANFSIRYVDADVSTPIIVENSTKIEYQSTKIEAHFKEAGEGYDFEIILKEKPVSNVSNFTIETKNLNFFYQPALTQQEIDDEVNRPDNVVGSYAVYHSTQKNHNKGQTNYKTGKAFHIYRPKAIDANNNSVWCDLSIDTNAKTLTVTIPQSFLDTATYPVIHNI